MKVNKAESLDLAIKYAKKFGFISKEFYWDFLTPSGTSTKYRYWGEFVKSEAFLPYRELKPSQEYFYLNLKSSKCKSSSLDAVGKRTPLYFYHDEKVMRLMRSLEQENLGINFCTEQELRSSKDSDQILKGSDSKLPDLIFDLKSEDKAFRFAVEVETTRKNNNRYFSVLLAYSKLVNIDLIIFATQQESIKMAIQKELMRAFFRELSKKVSFL
ncbi:MAG: hypothetical protein KDD45_04725, partial [Bdellovibrionales bacterium]|nr:hypothetical protein [Bdellovibrionales bacterium]